MELIMTRRRENNIALRKNEILNAALDLSISDGFQNLSRKAIAKRAEVSGALVTRYFKSMALLKKEIIKTAYKQEIIPILSQFVLLKIGNKINPEIKKRVIKYLTNL